MRRFPARLSARWLGLLGVGASAVTAFASGCGDPLRDAQIEALGPEASGVSPSEFHRPGQPCVLCHGAYQGDEPELVIGGTVNYKVNGAAPAAGALVSITDAEGDKRQVATNCIGNFMIRKSEWDPAFPLRVAIEYDDNGVPLRVDMASRIARDGSCGSCHKPTQTEASPGVVYMNVDATAEDLPMPGLDCAGVPR